MPPIHTIPYGRQDITREDILAVTEALQSDYLTQGPRIAEFEKAFARYAGCKYAVAVSNGTAALHLCALALDVKPGQRVITTPITFVASANCVRYCGGQVTFGDIDPDTYLLSVDSVEALLESAPKGTYKGIIPVDFAGRAADMEKFRKLADRYGLWIIEDACHAPGGFFIDSHNRKQLCGNGNYADATVFSFHPVKHIACGEGGMITTNNEELFRKLTLLRTHGIAKGNASHPYANSIEWATGGYADETEYPGWYMEMQQLGYNYRITDFQAALGTSQLKRAETRLARRRQIARAYNEAFGNKPYVLGQSGNTEGHAYHLYVLEVEDRLNLYRYLRENNIFAQIHYMPAHLMPYYRQAGGYREGDLPHAENYYRHCLSLPMFPSLTDREQQYVIDVIETFYNK